MIENNDIFEQLREELEDSLDDFKKGYDKGKLIDDINDILGKYPPLTFNS
jgi:hypothetical protein